MTKYRIKDKAIEKAVRGLYKTQRDFEEALFRCCSLERRCTAEDTVSITACVTESVTGCFCSVNVWKSDIEVMPEYDPKVWNDSSKVKPPKQGLYRVEWRDAQGVRRHRSACKWLGDYFESSIVSQNGPLTAFFKPWDDEE